jgi:hypothetical protein
MSVRLAQEGYRIPITIFMPICKGTGRQGDKGTRRQGDKETRRVFAISLYLLVSLSPCPLINLGATQQPMAAISIPAKTSTT